MDLTALMNYFGDMPTAHRSGLLIVGLTIFFLIENAFPLFSAKYNKVKHTGLNIFFTLTTVIINFLMAFILVGSSDWVVTNGVGIIQWIPMSGILGLIVGLLLMDFFGAFLPHYVEHRVKWMWQFHVIHHTDQNVDTTTANRHHPGESIIRFLFTTGAVFIAGAPIWMVMLYQSCSLVLSQFNHANISMPGWLDNALVLVFCTPNMHRVHHHYRQPYSDSNYGNIFSMWDRLFGSYRKVDNKKLVYGVDTYMDHNETTDVVNLLKVPFAGYRPTIQYEEEESL